MKKWQRFALSAVLLGNLVATPVWAEEGGSYPEVVVGTDTRTIVNNRLQLPYSAVVKIETYDKDGQWAGGGTGTLLEGNIVLTAAHCVLDSSGNFVGKIIVTPAYNRGEAPFGNSEATKFVIYKNYLSNAGPANDVAMIKLDTGFSSGVGALALSKNITNPLKIVGYPARLQQGEVMYEGTGNIKRQDTDYVLYDVDTNRGQSGSAILNNRNEIVGVHSTAYGGDENENGDYNGGALVTDKMQRLYSQLKNNRQFSSVEFTANFTPQQSVQASSDTYRMYNPNSGRHFYTPNAAERDSLVRAGWRYEGIAWSTADKGASVYRIYNPGNGEHHYTTNVAEKNQLVRLGWRDEGIAWKSGGNVNVYRLYNPNNGFHFYTANATERRSLIRAGWQDEGIGWKAVK